MWIFELYLGMLKLFLNNCCFVFIVCQLQDIECVVYQFKGYIILFVFFVFILYVKDYELYVILCYIYNKSMKFFLD